VHAAQIGSPVPVEPLDVPLPLELALLDVPELEPLELPGDAKPSQYATEPDWTQQPS
jgi:hypothetical protein